MAKNYFNSNNGIAVPEQWVSRTYWNGSSGDKIENIYTPCIFENFLDSSESPIKGYLAPENDSWMTDSISGNFFDGTKQFKGCIKKGRMPVFSSEGFITSGLKKNYFAKSASDTSTSAAFKPFFSVSQGDSFLIYPKDDCLEFTVAGNPPVKYTFYPSDFRDGVLPEVLYIVIQGAGGGGGGTTGSSNGGGGGAGGVLGALVNLKLAHNGQIQVSTGRGGVGGYKKETDSSENGKGTSGGSSYIEYWCNSSNFPTDDPNYNTNMWYSGFAWAYGGNPGRDAAVAGGSSCGGVGGGAEWSYPKRQGGITSESVLPDSSYLAVHAIDGGDGGAETKYGGGPKEWLTFRTTKTELPHLTDSTYHTTITPLFLPAGSPGNDRSGGGASSYFGYGGDGGVGGIGTSQSENHGRDGGLGAGGGGARYYLGRYNRGGDGGGGVALVFY